VKVRHPQSVARTCPQDEYPEYIFVCKKAQRPNRNPESAKYNPPLCWPAPEMNVSFSCFRNSAESRKSLFPVSAAPRRAEKVFFPFPQLRGEPKKSFFYLRNSAMEGLEVILRFFRPSTFQPLSIPNRRFDLSGKCRYGLF
jgi:hypothetical protein